MRASFSSSLVEGGDKLAAFFGDFGAAAALPARTGYEGRPGQQIVDRLDGVPCRFIAEAGDFRGLGHAAVLDHSFEQRDAVSPDQQPPVASQA